MRSYLFIESRGPQENPDAAALLDLASRLHDGGHPVTVYLVQNAVLALGATPVWEELADRGVEVLADDYSLASRGLDGTVRPPGVGSGAMPDLVRLLMAEDTVAVWH